MKHAVVLTGEEARHLFLFSHLLRHEPELLYLTGRNGLIDEILSSFFSSWRLGGPSLAPPSEDRRPFWLSTQDASYWPSLQEGVEQLMSDYNISTGIRQNFTMHNTQAPALAAKGIHIDKRHVSIPNTSAPRRAYGVRELAHSRNAVPPCR